MGIPKGGVIITGEARARESEVRAIKVNANMNVEGSGKMNGMRCCEWLSVQEGAEEGGERKLYQPLEINSNNINIL